MKQTTKGRPVAAALFFALALAFPLLAAPAPYHLELEARPGAPFPWLSKFGTIDIHVYSGGVRANSMGLSAFSVNGSKTITATNPIARMYTSIPLTEFTSMIAKLSSGEEQQLAPVRVEKPVAGKVGKLTALRHRLIYGEEAWIDVWTTDQIPANPQYRALVDMFVSGVSVPTAKMAREISGTPIFVELNFRRFKKVVLLQLKSVTRDNKGEQDALQTGSFYMKAPFLDSLWK